MTTHALLVSRYQFILIPSLPHFRQLNLLVILVGPLIKLVLEALVTVLVLLLLLNLSFRVLSEKPPVLVSLDVLQLLLYVSLLVVTVIEHLLFNHVTLCFLDVSYYHGVRFTFQS